MAQRISRFSVGQTSKVLAVLYGLGAIIAIPFLWLANTVTPPEEQIGIGFLLLFPILYAVLMFIITAIGCVLYNWVARMLGGIEVEIETAPLA